MRRYWLISLLALLVLTFSHADNGTSPNPKVKIGSKKFTESVILGEMLAHLARSAGAEPEHLAELGGTQFVWKGLLNGEIHVYADYTGTIMQETLQKDNLKDEKELRAALARRGVLMSRPLGFNNTYAIGMKESIAERLGIEKISDLRDHPELKLAFSNEFMDRADGWSGLRDRYRLPHTKVRGMDHDLSYRGLEEGDVHVIDAYSTDAEIPYYGLRVLEDDLRYFPDYSAVLLYRTDLKKRAPEVVAALLKLVGRIDEDQMQRLNRQAKLDGISETRVAAGFVEKILPIKEIEVQEETATTRLLKHTKEHLLLVGISLAAAIIVAVPLGILSAQNPQIGQVILGAAGIIQTIPALALLVFMIKPLGLQEPPAIAALFLYSLLPILRNTFAGLQDIPVQIHESAAALGLPKSARLKSVELPMACRMILAGIKTSAVMNIGFATLGAIIGAGGYGQPILTGIRRDDFGRILEGAVPAAVLALVVQGLFELVERGLVPRGLRLKPEA